ncbi:RICIN domain-containing protein [Dactylosporangium matsuzakiense]|uniref:Ricin B lectin domain-containing protein n=1 Tax=Dactylosporangium matsuzakiense TaxID=53360 RepID=A0A9W6KK96_9ACTN|nr:RICIN domain-containing protein [Dactylosporangium matsuzakiense]UWZ41552.1 RICIN domain-containing protein [Dactylosporangium matsuzakiense]GLL02385.1 hypothetical protein GCM10017581_041270 [Dactylosporangium matsuzakiense]
MTVTRGARLIAAALAGVALVLAGATPSFAAPFWEGRLQTLKPGPNNSTLILTAGFGIKSQAYVHYLAGSQYEDLAFTYDGAASGYYYILERGNNMTLSVLDNSHANGAAVVSYPYQTGNQYQMWHTISNNRIQNLATGNCLAIAGGTGPISSGAKVILYDCSTGPDQRWIQF